MKNRIPDGMIKFILMVSLKQNMELRPKWMSNKVKRCLQRKYTYYRKYLSYLWFDYTTDRVICGKLCEEYDQHRNIASSEKRKARKQYERFIADKW